MNRVLALIITLGVLIVLAFSCLFVVDQRQYAVVFALGEIKRVINEPGLYMKLPSPLQDVRYFDKRTRSVTVRWRLTTASAGSCARRSTTRLPGSPWLT